MSFRYTISVTPSDPGRVPRSIEFESHDDLFAIIDRMVGMDVVPSAEAPAFVLGLKLFAEAFLRHRREPAFAELANAFPAFMKQLKSRRTGA